MSMFSIHYLIEYKGKYWGGGLVSSDTCWVKSYDSVRFHTKESARKVIEGVFKDRMKDDIRIVDDE